MNLLLYINIVCTGIIFASSVIMFILGSKVISTRFHALFWLVIFFYSLFLTMDEAKVASFYRISDYIHYFIPAFSALFFMVELSERFRYSYLLILLVGVVGIIFFETGFKAIIYHLIAWSTLSILHGPALKLKRKKAPLMSGKKTKREIRLSVIFTVLAVFPFILVNLYFALFTEEEIYMESILPPCMAFISLAILYYSYKESILILNHDHFMNLDFIKKSSATEKRTIIEKISASLIHEIKNPVTAIQSLNQQLEKNIDTMPPEKIKQYITIMSEELNKVKSLSENYLASFRNKTSAPKQEINLYALINSIHTLLKLDLIKKNIALLINPNLESINIVFNSYQLRQVFLNLIYNAIEAHAERIEIYLAAGDDCYLIHIKDNGEGIDTPMKESIFTPFFTSKLDGTGMGLTICREIMHDNLGNITLLTSKPGETIYQLSINKHEGVL